MIYHLVNVCFKFECVFRNNPCPIEKDLVMGYNTILIYNLTDINRVGISNLIAPTKFMPPFQRQQVNIEIDSVHLINFF